MLPFTTAPLAPFNWIVLSPVTVGSCSRATSITPGSSPVGGAVTVTVAPFRASDSPRAVSRTMSRGVNVPAWE